MSEDVKRFEFPDSLDDEDLKKMERKEKERKKNLSEEKKRFVVKVCEHESDFETLENLLNQGYTVKKTVQVQTVIQSSSMVSAVFILELEPTEEITRVVSVETNMADEYLEKGWKVHDWQAAGLSGGVLWP